MVAIPIALMIIPTVIVLLFALLPTAVTFVMERGKGWYGGACVGSLNMAGAAPSLVELWFTGHTIEAAFGAIGNVFTILIIYGSAAIGWAIYSTTPSLISAYMVDDLRPQNYGFANPTKRVVAQMGARLGIRVRACRGKKVAIAGAALALGRGGIPMQKPEMLFAGPDSLAALQR